MAEYIEREALKSQIAENKLMAREPATKRILAMIDDMPTANVAPVVHGHWTQVDDTKCRCSNCDIIALIGLYPHGDKNYCPNCGAKLVEEEHNDV